MYQDGMVKAMTENPQMSKAEQEQLHEALKLLNSNNKHSRKLVKEAKGE